MVTLFPFLPFPLFYYPSPLPSKKIKKPLNHAHRPKLTELQPWKPPFFEKCWLGLWSFIIFNSQWKFEGTFSEISKKFREISSRASLFGPFSACCNFNATKTSIKKVDFDVKHTHYEISSKFPWFHPRNFNEVSMWKFEDDETSQP